MEKWEREVVHGSHYRDEGYQVKEENVVPEPDLNKEVEWNGNIIAHGYLMEIE